MSNELLNDLDAQTIAVQSGLNSDQGHNSVVAPIYLATNFEFDTISKKPDFDYSRGGNPTRDLLAQALAELERGKGAVVTSSGMAAINLVLQLLTPEDTLVAPKDCYGGTHRLFTSLAKRGGFKLAWLDFYADDLDKQIIQAKPQMIWLETPSNPLLRLTDIKHVCQIAKQVNAKVAVDNTFLSPLGQSPLALGADFVVHSSTKYLNGHGDVISGAVISANEKNHEQISWWANNTGVTGSPFDSYLILRGIRTLPIRIKQHSENALAVAETLLAHKNVTSVNYPGLSQHPDHELAQQQHKFHGGMVSFEIDADGSQMDAFVKQLKLFTLAESLGGTESLVCHPANMTHASMDAEAQKEAGITPQLIRLSVGIEAKRDLINDLVHALDSLSSVTASSAFCSENETSIEQESSATCRLSPALASLW
jgi:cystathionine gamma-synthase